MVDLAFQGRRWSTGERRSKDRRSADQSEASLHGARQDFCGCPYGEKGSSKESSANKSAGDEP